MREETAGAAEGRPLILRVPFILHKQQLDSFFSYGFYCATVHLSNFPVQAQKNNWAAEGRPLILNDLAS
jgi:hypothetical protein